MSVRLAGERATRLPMGLVQEALKLREAMLKLASDHLSANPVARPIIPFDSDGIEEAAPLALSQRAGGAAVLWPRE